MICWIEGNTSFHVRSHVPIKKRAMPMIEVSQLRLNSSVKDISMLPISLVKNLTNDPHLFNFK